MTFQITALDPARFAPLFDLDDAALAAQGARRVIATGTPGFPCRVSLADASPGETLVLVNHAHLPGHTPYAATHAIYVRQGAIRAFPAPGVIPEVLSRRLLSVRAYDSEALMIDAGVVAGTDVGPRLEALFGSRDVAFVHLHNAAPGCFAAAAVRA